MINPNICKYVLVEVVEGEKAIYQGIKLEIRYRGVKRKKLGKRRLYLKYSIMFDKYYLTDEC